MNELIDLNVNQMDARHWRTVNMSAGCSLLS